MLARQALAIQRKARGNDHPDLAGELQTNGVLLRELGRLAEAEPLLREALALSQKHLGNDHEVVALSANDLAGEYAMKESSRRPSRSFASQWTSIARLDPPTIRCARMRSADLAWSSPILGAPAKPSHFCAKRSRFARRRCRQAIGGSRTRG